MHSRKHGEFIVEATVCEVQLQVTISHTDIHEKSASIICNFTQNHISIIIVLLSLNTVCGRSSTMQRMMVIYACVCLSTKLKRNAVHIEIRRDLFVRG
jgi:hypothetical protein